MPTIFKLISWLVGGLVAIYAFIDAVRGYYRMYKEYGPNIHATVYHWWLSAPWRSTLSVAILGGLLIGIGFYFFASRPPTKETARQPDESRSGTTTATAAAAAKGKFEAMVIGYRYDRRLQEMSADIQYWNSESVRRTILGVMLIIHTPEMDINSCEGLGSNFNLWAPPEPLYVEPNAPVVITYRAKTDRETKGATYGVMIRVLTSEGNDYQTTIYAMKIETMGNLELIQTRPRPHKVSLDDNQYKTVNPFLTQPSPTPDKEALPPSPTSPECL